MFLSYAFNCHAADFSSTVTENFLSRNETPWIEMVEEK